MANFVKGMLFGCEKPFFGGERCVTSQKTAAEETNTTPEKFENATITGHFGFVAEENSGIETTLLS